MPDGASPSPARSVPFDRSWWGPPGGWKRIAGALSVVLALHVVSFAVLFAAVIPVTI